MRLTKRHWGGGAHEEARLRDVSRYFDAVNFCSRIVSPVLVGVGLADSISRPDGVFSAMNNVVGPVRFVVMPNDGHQSHHGEYRTAFADLKRLILLDPDRVVDDFFSEMNFVVSSSDFHRAILVFVC